MRVNGLSCAVCASKKLLTQSCNVVQYCNCVAFNNIDYHLCRTVVYLYKFTFILRLMRRHDRRCLNCARRGVIYFQTRSCIRWMYVLITLILRGQFQHLHLRLPQPAFMWIQSSYSKSVY